MAGNKKPRNTLKPLERAFLGAERKTMLESRNWYRNLAGGWTHPHCMDFMSRREILALSPAQLDYKLRHGSRAALPPELARHER